MSLNIWDQLTDPYDHSQLAGNFTKLDQHDHTTGKGVQIPTAGIQDGAITAAKIAPGTLPTFSIPNGSITAAMLAPGVLSVQNFGTFPSARITNNADQTLLADTSGFATVGFNTVNFDPDGMHVTPTSPSLTCQATGLYLITSTIAISQPNPFFYFNWNYDNGVQTRILLNGGTSIAQSSMTTAFTTFWFMDYSRGTVVSTITTIYRLNLNDTITVQAGIGTPTYYFTVPSLPSYSPTLSVAWIGN